MGGQNSYQSGQQPQDRSRRSCGRGQFSRSTRNNASSNNTASAPSSLGPYEVLRFPQQQTQHDVFPINYPSNQQEHMLLQQQFQQLQMEQNFSVHYGQRPHTTFGPGSDPSVPAHQPLHVIKERPYLSPNVKAKWPELVGTPAATAEAAILSETNFGVEVIVVPEGSFVAMDYRMDRVWLWVGDDNMVLREPTLG